MMIGSVEKKGGEEQVEEGDSQNAVREATSFYGRSGWHRMIVITVVALTVLEANARSAVQLPHIALSQSLSLLSSFNYTLHFPICAVMEPLQSSVSVAAACADVTGTYSTRYAMLFNHRA
jgi:hypothetical protein